MCKQRTHKQHPEIRSASLQHVTIYKASSDRTESPERNTRRGPDSSARSDDTHTPTASPCTCGDACVSLSSDVGQGASASLLKGDGLWQTIRCLRKLGGAGKRSRGEEERQSGVRSFTSPSVHAQRERSSHKISLDKELLHTSVNQHLLQKGKSQRYEISQMQH